MQKTHILIDLNTKSQISATGEYITRSDEYITIERGQWQVICFEFVNRIESSTGVITLEPVSFNANTSFMLVADNDFNDENALMLKSIQSVVPFSDSNPESNRINIAGDWIDGGTADLALGQLSVRVNSDTVKFNSIMDNQATVSKNMYINVKQFMQGITNPTTIAWLPFVALNTIRDWSSAQENPPTGTDYISQIDAYLSNGFERQWSDDGINWVSSQTADSNKYFRERIANIGAEWSPAFEVARGYTFIPSVSSSGVISWTNDGDLVNPTPVNVKGAKGDNGTTPSINALNNHWMIGTTDTGVNASGALWQIPRVLYSYNDTTYGTCNRLDTVANVIEFMDVFDTLDKIKLKVKSASSTISGNITLNCTFTDGTNTETKTVTVAVGLTSGWVVIDLSTMTLRSGKLTITRDYSATTDTLKDGETVITAVVTAVRYKELD